MAANPSIYLLALVALLQCQISSSSPSPISGGLIQQQVLSSSYLQSASHQQLQNQQQSQPQLSFVSIASANFEPANYKSVHEAIRAHPELREFAQLCEADGVKEIVRMDRTPLTVFAPVDKSMGDLLHKAKTRPSINLVDVAKHHIAQGFIAPDESTKYPLQFTSYSSLSPLYLNQIQPANQVYVNNAKILATYLIPIDADNFQTLHLIDSILDYAYLNRKAQMRSASPQSSRKTTTTTKRSSFSLDDLLSSTSSESPIVEFYERFADLQASQPQVDLYHARVYKGTQQQKISMPREYFNLEQLNRVARQFPELRGKFYNVNESNSLNTYFLPVNSDELSNLMGDLSSSSKILEAHMIPGQVLFTRTMGLGQLHPSLLDQDASSTNRVSLSLAKTLPISSQLQVSSELAEVAFSGAESHLDDEQASRRLLATPLILQSKSSIVTSNNNNEQFNTLRPGLTNAEILIANIPLSNGVLHLIRKPILLTESSLLDYINDNDSQLSDVINSMGSQSSSSSSFAIVNKPINSYLSSDQPPVASVARFRELLARERQVLNALSMEPQVNRTILAPSDEAFARLRYDLRALVQGDESLIPKHWDSSYRQDLLQRLVKRHMISSGALTSNELIASGNLGTQIITDNGKLLSFSQEQQQQILVESDGTQARLLHKDLIGTNGVLHVIDRVLGEEQETVYTLLKSIVFKYNHSLEESNLNSNELNSQIQNAIRQAQSQQQEMISTNSNDLANLSPSNQHEQQQQQQQQSSQSTRKQIPELVAISRAIGQYLEDLSASNRRQLQMLASSVNISFQLARLTSLADGLDDWNEKFKSNDKLFTYFVPSDLAWIRLQQSQPELYKPLMLFLESSQPNLLPLPLEETTEHPNGIAASQQQQQHPTSSSSLSPVSLSSPRSSESSHRLRQILERHLVVNRKLVRRELERLDSVQTQGATLRLVDSVNANQLTAFDSDPSASQTQAPSSTFAALHSIVTGNSVTSQQLTPANGGAKFGKILRLANQPDGAQTSANIVQFNEASNGVVYIIDSVLLQPDDADYIQQTSSTPAISSTMSSLLGAHNSAILDFIHNLTAGAIQLSAQSMLALIGTLTLAIAALLILSLVLVIRRRRLNKLHSHQQLESGLTSSSSANSGSTSTTKSL